MAPSVHIASDGAVATSEKDNFIMNRQCQAEHCLDLEAGDVEIDDDSTGRTIIVRLCEEHSSEHYDALEQDLMLLQVENGSA
jgi:hypothetical protein